MEKKIKFLIFGLSLLFILFICLVLRSAYRQRTTITEVESGKKVNVQSDNNRNNSAPLMPLGKKSAIDIRKSGHNYYFPGKKKRVVNPFDDDLDSSNEMFQESSLPGEEHFETDRAASEQKIILLPRNMDPSEYDEQTLSEPKQLDISNPLAGEQENIDNFKNDFFDEPPKDL
ncbi:MAG: hypothetical protein L6416_02110 [Candidatus Omnitrophica bacterium]|nr:hypothetical protein [Candidatus Omnitrophota bacterium]